MNVSITDLHERLKGVNPELLYAVLQLEKFILSCPPETQNKLWGDVIHELKNAQTITEA